MRHELTVEERYSWLRATLEHLAAIPRLSGSEVAYIVFETLDPDVRSCFDDSNLEPLVRAARVSLSMKQELLDLRAAFLRLLDAAYAVPSICEKIRCDMEWLEVSQQSSRLLSSLVAQ